MCLTDSASLAEKIRRLRDHGMVPNRWYWHETVGYNYRITNMQAALGFAQVSRVGETLARNDRLLALYRKHFDAIAHVAFPPQVSAEYEPITWLVCVQVPARRRASLFEIAQSAGIELRPFFTPLSTMPIYREFASVCPNSVAVSATGVNLPTSVAIDETVVERIATVFRDALSGQIRAECSQP
jgi:perosamine synthetase